MLRIAVDTGGTFTDFVIWDGKALNRYKLPSFPADPAKVIITGLKKYFTHPFTLIHGTTVATNAFLEGKMAKTAFICTRGFEHILHIGRQNRVELFNLRVTKPPCLIPLNLCFGLEERILADGTIKKKANPAHIKEWIQILKSKNVEAVGLVLLHSYQNPAHEEMVSKPVRDAGIYLTASSEIMPEYREYERAVVTVLNAALMPVMSKYIRRLEEALGKNKLYIIQSNGGLLSPEMIRDEPIRTLLSGPAGGVIAAQKIADKIGIKEVITLDMGGTSTDVSVVKNGRLTLSKSARMNHLPIGIPMIDIETVGAGGGSIARLDRAKVLQVGPQSAGADPGPSCYGKSDSPTVTDAFVVIGAIVPSSFLGGRMKIYPERSFAAIESLAKQIRRTVYETAEGIIQIAVSSIERALRSITIEKGEDPRVFSLMPFGGAGGLIAVALAERLGIRRIVVPGFGGVFSAFGMLFSDYTKEHLKSVLKPYDEGMNRLIRTEFKALKGQILPILSNDGFSERDIQWQETIEMRYQGQSYELTVNHTEHFLKEFHQQHQQLYSYRLEDKDCEIVNIRLRAVGQKIQQNIDLKRERPQVNTDSPMETREIFHEGAFVPYHFYERQSIKAQAELRSPAVVMSEDSTVMINDRFSVETDEYANLIINQKQAE